METWDLRSPWGLNYLNCKVFKNFKKMHFLHWYPASLLTCGLSNTKLDTFVLLSRLKINLNRKHFEGWNLKKIVLKLQIVHKYPAYGQFSLDVSPQGLLESCDSIQIWIQPTQENKCTKFSYHQATYKKPQYFYKGCNFCIFCQV